MILHTLFGSRSLENPSTQLSDLKDWDEIAPNRPGASTINEARSLPPLYRAVSLIANDVARLPLDTLRRVENGKEKETGTQLFRLLARKPNPLTTSFVWRRTMVWHMLIRGNGYSYIQRDSQHRPRAIWSLDPDTVTATIVKDEAGEMRRFYLVKLNDGREDVYDSTDIIHFAGPGWDGFRGWPATNVMADTITAGQNMRRFGIRFFENNARPGMVLMSEKMLSPDQIDKLREQWTKSQAGIDNAHKVSVLPAGMKVETITTSAKDSMLEDAKKFNVLDVSNFFGVPPHKLGDSSRTAYNSLTEENQSYLDEALDPWLCLIESELYDKLLPERDKASDSRLIEFNRAALLRANIQARGEFYAKALAGAPFMTPEEVRVKEDMLPEPTLGAIRMPTNNFAPPEEPTPAPDDSAELARHIRAKYTAEVDRIARRIRANIERKGAGWWAEHKTTEHDSARDVLGDLRSALILLGDNVPEIPDLITSILQESA